MKIISSDSCLFIFPPAQIYDIILDFNSYKNWWPKYIFFKIVDIKSNIAGAKINVYPYGFTGFVWLVKELKPDKKIVFEYSGGAYSGTGIWSIEKEGEKTRLTYAVELTVKNPFIKLASPFINVQAMHRRLMKKVFARLENYLNY